MTRINTHSIVTALVAFVASLAWGNEASAQTVVSQTFTSGDMAMYGAITIALEPYDTVVVEARWSMSPNFTVPYNQPVDTLTTDGTGNVFTRPDTIGSPEGFRYFQYIVDGVYQDTMQTYVRTLPTGSIVGYTWTATSFTVNALATAGDTTATAFLEVNPFTSDFNDVNAFPVFDTSFSSMINFSKFINELPDGSDVSFRFKVVNSLGMAYSDTISLSLDMTPQTPWVGSIVISEITQTTATATMEVVNYDQSCTLQFYIFDETTPNEWLMGVPLIAASEDVVTYSYDLTGLTAGHHYNLVTQVSNALGTSPSIPTEFVTLDEQEELSISDTGNSEATSPTSTEVHSELFVPSGITVDTYLYVSHANNPDVSEPFFATDVATFESGIWYPSYTVESLEEGEQYYGKWIAIGSDGSYTEDIFSFTQEEYIIPTSVIEETMFAKQYYANGMLYGCAESNVSLYDISGSFLYATKVGYGVQHIQIPITDTGVYIANIIPNDSSQSIKIVEFIVEQ